MHIISIIYILINSSLKAKSYDIFQNLLTEIKITSSFSGYYNIGKYSVYKILKPVLHYIVKNLNIDIN